MEIKKSTGITKTQIAHAVPSYNNTDTKMYQHWYSNALGYKTINIF